MKICLAALHHNARFIPLAVLYLKAYLVEQHGHAFDSIAIEEFNHESEPDTIVGTILAHDPDVVGFSCYVWNIKMLTDVSRRIKARRPATRIVFGGPEVGPVAVSSLHAHPAIDVIVKSEGEIPFAEMTARWQAGSDLGSVRGICFRDGGRIIDNADAAPLKDLNHLSSPHLPEYANHTNRIVCIETQRGCVFRCNFCFYNKDYSIRNRRFDLDRVKKEILFWLQRDVRQIYLMDPVFNLYADRAKEICRFVVEHNHRRVPFHAEVWAEFIDEELARLMYEANFTFVEVGLQTTDADVLKTVERRLKLEKFLAGIGHLKRFKLDFEVQLIYGLPGETMPSFRKSLDFAAALDPPQLAIFPLMVLPGTELWRKAEALALRFDPEPPYYIKSHPSMTSEEIEYGWKINDAVNDLSPSRAIRLLSREPGVTFSEVVDSWIAWEPDKSSGAAMGETVGRFLQHFCEQKRIPPEFYQSFAALEFASAG
jgi:radical SAM superfamily enzyme YgiQ (UPF0313 family)